MNKILIISALSLFAFFACAQPEKNDNKKTQKVSELQPGVHAGVVLDKLDTGEYSYLKLKEKDDTYWIAVPTMDISEGETVYFSSYMEMKDYHSKTLDKTFESVLFVADARKTAEISELKTAHSNVTTKGKTDVSVEPLEDGQTVAQIFSNKDALKNKTVRIKGKVVKYNPEIMGRNWIHIQDGTESDGNFDLLLTSQDEVNVGDVIVAEGTLSVDKDYGAGYVYPVVIEKAKITVEK